MLMLDEEASPASATDVGLTTFSDAASHAVTGDAKSTASSSVVVLR